MAARGTLPSSAASPMKASRAGDGLFPLDASSPAPKPRAAEAAETPPRTPGKKQCGDKGGKVAGGAAKGATPPSVTSKGAAKCATPPSVSSKGKADAASVAGAAPATSPASMPPPKVPSAKAKAKAAGRRRRGKFPEFPALMSPERSTSNLEPQRRPQLPGKLPEDNYEISDREESSDEIPLELDRSEKLVPGWVEGFEDRAARQFDVDPGSVFGRGVPACDLDDIFPDALYRKVNKVKIKRVRGSSCRWGPDRLKGSEIREYAQKMGQRRRLSMFQRASLAASSARPAKKMRGGA